MWNWKKGHMIGIHIDGLWNDPRAKLVFKRIIVSCKTTSYRVFYSFYEDMEKGPPPISCITRNFFLSLSETIAQFLYVTPCYVCRGEQIWGVNGFGRPTS
jgi:hypothetical protein